MSTTPTLRDAAPQVADLLIRITNCAKHWAYMAEIDNGDAAKVEAHRHGELLAELVAALTQGAGAVEPVAEIANLDAAHRVKAVGDRCDALPMGTKLYAAGHDAWAVVAPAVEVNLRLYREVMGERATPSPPVPYKHVEPDCEDPALLWAEIHHLRAAVQGPPGFATWQEAATAERVRRVAVERNAKRYEWLRAQHWSDAPLCVVADPKNSVKLARTCPFGDQLDAAIDKEMNHG